MNLSVSEREERETGFGNTVKHWYEKPRKREKGRMNEENEKNEKEENVSRRKRKAKQNGGRNAEHAQISRCRARPNRRGDEKTREKKTRTHPIMMD